MSYVPHKNVPSSAIQQLVTRWLPVLMVVTIIAMAGVLWLRSHSSRGDQFNLAFAFIACAALLFFLGWAVRIVLRLPYRLLVGSGMFAVLALIVAMHAVSPSAPGTHPDEALHLSSFGYFLKHAWPPAADSPNLVPVLKSTAWGISYLNEYDVVYFIAGHLASPFMDLVHSPMSAARIFQMLLWVVLLLCALRRERWAILLAPVLISAQVWYVFSYFNGDAFPVCLSMLATMLAADGKGGVSAYLNLERKLGGALLVFACCLGFLLVSKANYALVVVGLILFLGLRSLGLSWLELATALVAVGTFGIAAFLGKWPVPSPLLSRTLFLVTGAIAALVFTSSLIWRTRREAIYMLRLRRFITLGLLVLAFAAPRVVDDLWLNGTPSHKALTVASVTEEYAQGDFKPSSFMTSGGRANFRLAQKGKPLNDMLYGMSWYSVSFRSAFGVYGHMVIWADDSFYLALFGLFALMIILATVAQIRVHRSLGAKTILLVVAACGIALVSSILYSWLADFEPQGRYLLPFLPFISLLLAPSFDTKGRSVMKLLLIVAFMVNIYSYAYIGIAGVEALEHPAVVH